MRYDHFSLLPERAFEKRPFGGMTLEGGGGSGGNPQPTQQTVTQTNIPEYAKPYVESMLGATQQQIFNMSPSGQITGIKPYVPYSTDPSAYVAGFSPLQQQAFQGTAGLQLPAEYQAAAQATGAAGAGSMGLGTQAAQAGQQYAQMATTPGSVQQYMSPYVQAALQPQLAEMQRQSDIVQQGLKGQAVAAGAFGGSRQALQAAEQERNKQALMSQAIGQGYQSAYDKAMQSMQYGAGLGLQGLQTGLAGYGQGLQAAGQLAGIGGQSLQSQMGILGAQQQAGSQQQQQQQNIINQAIQNYATAQQYPQQQLAFMNAMIRGLPLQTQTVQGYQAAPSMLSQAAGLGTAGLGLYGLGNKAGIFAEGGEVKGYADGGITAISKEVLLNPDKFSESSIKRLMAEGIVDETVGLPALRTIELERKKMQDAQAMAAQRQPSIKDQILADAGIEAAPIDEEMFSAAGGGIVAFEGGGQALGDRPNYDAIRGNRRKHPFEDMVIEQARARGEDPTRALEILYRESSPTSKAATALSPKGAVGLMQVMPDTAMKPGYGVPNIFDLAVQRGIKVKDRSKETAAELLTNPALNIEFGSLYRNAMEKKFGGDPTMAAAAYNAGPGRVERKGGIPNIPETKKYIAGIIPADKLAMGPKVNPSWVQRQEEAAKKVQQAWRDQTERPTLAPIENAPILPSRSVMDRPPSPPKDYGIATPSPTEADVAKRQQEFSDYLSGNRPITKQPLGTPTEADVAKRQQEFYDYLSGTRPITKPSLKMPTEADVEKRQKQFQDYLFGNTPIPAPTIAQQAMKTELEKEEKAKQDLDVAKTEEKVTPKTEEKKPTYEELLNNLLAAREKRAGEQRQTDKDLALLAAGLGMLSSRSPYGLVGIGEGGLKGLEQYAAGRKQLSKEEEDTLMGRLGQYRYGEEARLRGEDKRLDQGMRLASAEENRIREQFKDILSNFADPRRAKLAEIIKTNPGYIDQQAIAGRNRILQVYGIDIPEMYSQSAQGNVIDFGSIQPKKK